MTVAGLYDSKRQDEASAFATSHDNIFTPPVEPITSGSQAGIIATARSSPIMGYQQQNYQYDSSQQYDYGYGDSYQQQQQYSTSQADGQYYQGEYNQYPQQQQQEYQSYDQYQDVPLTPTVGAPTISAPVTGGATTTGRAVDEPEDVDQNHHFLRELRE